MSFVVGGLFLNESMDVARLHDPSEQWDATLLRALDEGITSLPKAASRRRALREIVNRISTLNDAELEFFVEVADRTDQQALLWLAVCREYRFVREFATEVIRERFLSLQLNLPLDSFDTFFAAKAEWNDGLAGISPTTRSKLRQVLYRIMREAGVITQDSQIVAGHISPRLKALVEEHSPPDLLLFTGMHRQGGAA
jgi:hypothetical protein